jgi:hypothetical protein
MKRKTAKARRDQRYKKAVDAFYKCRDDHCKKEYAKVAAIDTKIDDACDLGKLFSRKKRTVAQYFRCTRDRTRRHKRPGASAAIMRCGETRCAKKLRNVKAVAHRLEYN